MARNRDTSSVTAHWHLDCRLIGELPEDRVVGTRFLINAPFASAALSAVLVASWQGYRDVNLRRQIVDWDGRIKDTAFAVHDVERMHAEYAVESAKIDGAFAMIKTPFVISEFIATIGQTRPPSMVVDSIEWADAGIVIRGSLQQNSERASQILGAYVKELKDDPKIGPYFRTIILTGLERGNSEEGLSYEITFHLMARKA